MTKRPFMKNPTPLDAIDFELDPSDRALAARIRQAIEAHTKEDGTELFAGVAVREVSFGEFLVAMG